MTRLTLTVIIIITVAVSLVASLNRIYDSRDLAVKQLKKESIREQQIDTTAPQNPAQQSAGGNRGEDLGDQGPPEQN